MEAPDMLELAQNRVIASINEEDKASKRPQRVISPTIWLGIFTAALQLIRECRKLKAANGEKAAVTAAVAESLVKPNMVQKIKLHRMMISQVGRVAFRAHGSEIHQHLLKVAAEAKPEERLAFVEQAAQG